MRRTVALVTPETTPRQQLASDMLAQPVQQWIGAFRKAGVSYIAIARLLRTATDGRVDISGEAVRQWHVAAQTDAA